MAFSAAIPNAASSISGGTWKDRPWGGPLHRPALRARAPQHWYGRQAAEPPTPTDAPKEQAQGGPLHRQVSTPSSRKAWARLLAKVYELDLMACPQCGSRMAVIAVIRDPAEIRKIISCLAKHGRGPPTVG